jgi:DNA-binding XRE family transcriptional regulator
MPAGRPPKFDERAQKLCLFLATKGFTDKEMAQALEITETTLNNWKKKRPEFFEALNEAKDIADRKVVRSLYERATGYSHPEQKIFNHNGKLLVADTIKHYPPDSTSMIFWLKNRKKEEWRDKQEVEVDLPKTIKVVYDRKGD